MAASNINQSVGTIFFAQDTQRVLFLLRSRGSHSHENTWAFVGGKVERGETVIDALHREIGEEIGSQPEILKMIPLEKFTNNNKAFEYHTFVAVVAKEFIPALNGEHSGYAWTGIDAWPKPLHPGVHGTFKTSELVSKLETIVFLFRNS